MSFRISKAYNPILARHAMETAGIDPQAKPSQKAGEKGNEKSEKANEKSNEKINDPITRPSPVSDSRNASQNFSIKLSGSQAQLSMDLY